MRRRCGCIRAIIPPRPRPRISGLLRGSQATPRAGAAVQIGCVPDVPASCPVLPLRDGLRSAALPARVAVSHPPCSAAGWKGNYAIVIAGNGKNARDNSGAR